VIVSPLAATALKEALPVPLVFPRIIAPAVDVNAKAPWLEVVRKGTLLPVVLINEIAAPVPGFARVAVTSGLGAVIYE
jgi:hypothetical protein